MFNRLDVKREEDEVKMILVRVSESATHTGNIKVPAIMSSLSTQPHTHTKKKSSWVGQSLWASCSNIFLNFSHVFSSVSVKTKKITEVNSRCTKNS